MDPILQHLGLCWTFYCSCFLGLSATVWRTLINAMLSSAPLISVTVAFGAFESFVDPTILMAGHQRAVSVIDILITSVLSCSYFTPSLFGTLSLFVASITFALERFLWLFFSVQLSKIPTVA